MTRVRATVLLVLCCVALVLHCTPAQQAAAMKVDDAVMAKLNSYCDGRHAAIDALGEAGARP